MCEWKLGTRNSVNFPEVSPELLTCNNGDDNNNNTIENNNR